MTEIKRFRARSEIIEAIQLGPNYEDVQAAVEFCSGVSDAKVLLDPNTKLPVLVTDGPCIANVGDWLLRDGDGVQPYSVEEFAQLYEPVP